MNSRGCRRTALEFSKYLLSLEPTVDHYGAIFLIDFYAIRSKQWDWYELYVKQFAEEYHGSGSLLSLPNVMFTLALAKAMRDLASGTELTAPIDTLTKLESVEDI